MAKEMVLAVGVAFWPPARCCESHAEIEVAQFGDGVVGERGKGVVFSPPQCLLMGPPTVWDAVCNHFSDKIAGAKLDQSYLGLY